jgi:Family of unknown function (DUF5762)
MTDTSSNIMKNDAPHSLHKSVEKGSVPFWLDDPNILFQPPYLFELFPVDTMTYNQKLNAISRSILILAIIGFLLSRNTSVLFVTVITLGAIVLLQKYQTQKEGYRNPATDYLHQNGGIPTDVFSKPTAGNPFGNVLIPDYDYNVNRKPAPPSYNENTNQDILQQAKQLVINANPDQPDIADKLFQDLADEFVFEQSMRPFYSNPATTIPNDQEAFSQFCYGSMVSCKEGNSFACARNLDRHTNQ